MAVNLTTLSDRIGKGGYLLHLVNEFRGATGLAALSTDLPTEWEDFVAEYDGAGDAIRACVDNMLDALGQARSGLSGIQSAIADSVQATLIEMVNADTPLSELEIGVALDELILQMLNAGDTVNENTVTVTATMGDLHTNAGDGVCVVYAKDDKGGDLQYALAEKIRCNITGTATAGEEVWSVAGEAGTDLLDWQWPLGSASSQTLAAISAVGSSNLLANGGFEDFTIANTPDDWIVGVGTVGVHIFSTVTSYAGDTALKLTSDGATAAQINQVMADLLPRTPYAISAWVRVSAATAGGSTILQLVDADTDLPLEDEAGNLAKLTIANVGLTTGYVNYSLAFTLRDPLPPNVEFRAEITASTTSGRSVYIDHLSLALMGRQYFDGPAVAFFSGATRWLDDDNAKIVVTNDYAGLLQTILWRCCDLASLARKIPSSGSPSVSDSCVS